MSDHEFLASLERVWNKKAISLLDEYKIDLKPEQFRISVFEDERPDNRKQFPVLMKIHNAPVVQLLVLYPQPKVVKTILRGLRYIANPRIHGDEDMLNPLVNGSVLHELTMTGEGRGVWLRSNYDKADLYKNVRAKREFEVSVKRIITVTHKKSKISVKVQGDTSRNEWDLMREGWIKCSRAVNEHNETRAEQFKPKSVALVPMSMYEAFATQLLDNAFSGSKNNV